MLERQQDVAAGGELDELVGVDADRLLIDRYVHLPHGEVALDVGALEVAAVEGDAHAIDGVAALGLPRVEAPLLVGRERVRLQVTGLCFGGAAARGGAGGENEREREEEPLQTGTFFAFFFTSLPSDLKKRRLSQMRIGAATKIDE